MSRPTGIHWPSIGLIVLAGLGILTSLCLIGVTGLVGIFSLIQQDPSVGPVLTLIWLLVVLIALSVPAIVLSVRRLMGLAEPDWHLKNAFGISAWAVAFWPVLLVGGDLIARQAPLNWLVTPFFTLLGVGLPLWFFLETGRRGLPAYKLQRRWGAFNVSVFTTMPVVFMLELTGALVLIVGGVIWLTYDSSALGGQLNLLLSRIANAEMNPEVIQRAVQQAIRLPGAVTVVLVLAAGLVPLFEELLKPLAVWLLGGRSLTAPEGFELGLLCGCAFAMLESVAAVAGNSGADMAWGALTLARAGTGLLHITTSGLVGMALARSWQEKRMAPLVLTYLGAVGLHVAWNTVSLILGLGSFFSGTGNWMEWAGMGAPFVLGVLAAAMLLILVRTNRRMAAEAAPAAGEAEGSEADLKEENQGKI